VQKVIRSLHLRFDAKLCSIEEIKDLKKLTMDEMHGILTTYEMRKEIKSNMEGRIFQRIKEDKQILRFF
jgi:hypothetical protein